MALIGKLFPAAGALLVAGTLGAQAAAKPTCDADATKGNLAKAAFSVEQARTAQGTPGAQTIMANAVKQLEAAKGEDPTVQALFLGQTLAFWLAQPNMSPTPKRGVLGFTQNAESTIDLVSTIDSLFRVVERAKPACTELTGAYRGGLPGYLALVNSAIGALNAEKLDSAEYYASRANMLYAGSPYGTMVLGSVAAKRKDEAKAQEYWTAAATTAATDTIYRDVERSVLMNQAMAYMATATRASGAERDAAARRAIATYTRLLQVPGTTGAYAASSRSNLQSAYLLVGDTAAFVASYQPMLSNPTGFEYGDLLGTAVNAARANRTADAARLFEATLAQNPYNRDALFNLAVVYLTLEQNDKVGPVVSRLVAVDPGNPENYNLAARAYLARAKSAEAAKRSPLAKAFNDTTMTWYSRGNKLPVEVTFSEFNAGEKTLTLAGSVLDRRDKVEGATPATPARPAARGARAAAKPTFAPVAVTLRIEALDKAGTVVGSQTVTTEPLTPGKAAAFSATIDATNAVAYRYTLGG